ncbi:hypothetical protein BN946_scf185043.g136 [Trametes cinnabarina]|uniref:BOD1/SHG1 domain-containing protein n=1 Tax=Pycnoporus cinnabarinus TaxID=5643 RepID=A0A060SIQ3_PYCCI|nr:hypothetical protein BN946_scf185043.g136 [Trametes cinnabarina]
MSNITNPTQLVEECDLFKKSGEFDRLRRELLKEFRQSVGLCLIRTGMAAFVARVEDIAKQKLASDAKLQYMPEATVTREIMQELERYPIVERAVADSPSLSSPAFATGVKSSIQKVLQAHRKGTNGTFQAAAKTDGVTSTPGANHDSDSDSSAESMDLEDDESSD